MCACMSVSECVCVCMRASVRAWIHAMSRVRPAASLAWQKLQRRQLHTHLLRFSIAVMLIGTIDCYHFIPLSMTMTLAGDHKSAQSKTLAFIFSNTFQAIKMKFYLEVKQFKLNILTVLLSQI